MVCFILFSRRLLIHIIHLIIRQKARWHNKVRIDHIPVKQARTVRAKEAAAAAAAAAATTTI